MRMMSTSLGRLTSVGPMNLFALITYIWLVLSIHSDGCTCIDAEDHAYMPGKLAAMNAYKAALLCM